MRDGTGYAYTHDTTTCTAKCEGCGGRYIPRVMQFFALVPGMSSRADRLSRVFRQLDRDHIAKRVQLYCCSLRCGGEAMARLGEQGQYMLEHPEAYPPGFAWLPEEEQVPHAV